MGISLFDESQPLVSGVELTDAASYPADVLGFTTLRFTRIDQVIASSDDTVDLVLRFSVNCDESVYGDLGSVNLPAGSGYDPATPPIDVFPSILATLDHVTLTKYDHLHVRITPAISAGKTVRLFCSGGYL